MFEFKPTGNGQQSSSSEYKEVDWKAMQEYTVIVTGKQIGRAHV